jgi:hypothetical protein
MVGLSLVPFLLVVLLLQIDSNGGDYSFIAVLSVLLLLGGQSSVDNYHNLVMFLLELLLCRDSLNNIANDGRCSLVMFLLELLLHTRERQC